MTAQAYTQKVATEKHRQREAESRTMLLPQIRKAWDHLQLEEGYSRRSWEHPDSILGSGAEKKLRFFSVSDRSCRTCRNNQSQLPQPTPSFKLRLGSGKLISQGDTVLAAIFSWSGKGLPEITFSESLRKNFQ